MEYNCYCSLKRSLHIFISLYISASASRRNSRGYRGIYAKSRLIYQPLPGRLRRNVRFPRDDDAVDGRGGHRVVERRPLRGGRHGRAGGRGLVLAERPEHRVAVHVHQERLLGLRAIRGEERDRHQGPGVGQ